MKSSITALVFAVMASSSFAFVPGGSNLDIFGYPEFKEMEPSAPYSRDNYAYDNYRFEVEQYVEAARKYVENANNDVLRTQEAAEEAIKKANQAVEDFNDWARRGY